VLPCSGHPTKAWDHSESVQTSIQLTVVAVTTLSVCWLKTKNISVSLLFFQCLCTKCYFRWFYFPVSHNRESLDLAKLFLDPHRIVHCTVDQHQHCQPQSPAEVTNPILPTLRRIYTRLCLRKPQGDQQRPWLAWVTVGACTISYWLGRLQVSLFNQCIRILKAYQLLSGFDDDYISSKGLFPQQASTFNGIYCSDTRHKLLSDTSCLVMLCANSPFTKILF